MSCKASARRAATDPADERVVPLKGRRRGCPICGKPVSQTYRPFCSQRCADLDLGRWLKGHYRIPSEEPAEEDDLAGRGEE